MLEIGANPNTFLGNTSILIYVIGMEMDRFNEGFPDTPSLDKIKLLVEYGANINFIDKNNFSPLGKAIAYGHKEAQDYLKGLGAKTPKELEEENK